MRLYNFKGFFNVMPNRQQFIFLQIFTRPLIDLSSNRTNNKMKRIANQQLTFNQQFMFGASFSEFIQTGTDPGKKFQPHYTHSHPNNFKPFSIDMCQNQIDMVLTKSFNQQSYPVDFSMVNPFCPICGKFVKEEEKPLIYESKKFSKNFLAHQACLNKEEANSMLSAIYEENEQAKIIPFGLKKEEKSIPLGGQQFYLEMKISHALSDFVFLKQSAKISSMSTFVKWQVHLEEEIDPYIPTIICFPFSDFKLSLTLTCMATGQKTVYKSYINLGRLKYNQLKVVTASTQEMKIELKIYYGQEQKQNLIDEMNFKYRYSIKLPVPIVELVAIQAIVPDQEDDDDRQLQSSLIDRVIDDSPSQTSTVQISAKVPCQIVNSDNFSQRSYDKQKINFDQLINSQSLGNFVRNNSQSRQFQNFLNQANTKQVDLIIQTLYLELPDLITHEYANYMVQKLFSVCNYTQRLKVMQRLHEDIANIVRNKQGTHTIQALIKFFTNDQEYKLMCESIKENFFQLSCHPNATHFIQKIIGLFPILHTYPFFELAQKNFLDFALDKNAMCVIKHMMKLISELQRNHPSQKVKELTSEAKKKFINEVTFCIDKIIQDAFGNYIIQFCYELFGEDKCAGITQMITERFPQFAIQKYSSSVVYKCVSCYWVKKESFNRLKQTLTPEAIIELFRNKDGNKILLEIMERHQTIPVRDKIYNQLLMGEPTKFNHDRWGVIMGIRSGVMGTEYTSFSEALKKSSPYKYNKKSKHYQ